MRASIVHFQMHFVHKFLFLFTAIFPFLSFNVLIENQPIFGHMQPSVTIPGRGFGGSAQIEKQEEEEEATTGGSGAIPKARCVRTCGVRRG